MKSSDWHQVGVLVTGFNLEKGLRGCDNRAVALSTLASLYMTSFYLLVRASSSIWLWRGEYRTPNSIHISSDAASLFGTDRSRGPASTLCNSLAGFWLRSQTRGVHPCSLVTNM